MVWGTHRNPHPAGADAIRRHTSDRFATKLGDIPHHVGAVPLDDGDVPHDDGLCNGEQCAHSRVIGLALAVRRSEEKGHRLAYLGISRINRGVNGPRQPRGVSRRPASARLDRFQRERATISGSLPMDATLY